MNNEILGCSITDKSVSKTKYVNHVFRRVTGFKRRGKITESVEMNNEVIILPGGGLVLPYFRDSRGRWKVVLVSQYRPAIKEKTIEAAGGRLDGEAPAIALSRELSEETHIKVKPEIIKIVVHEYTHPSILSTCSFGGIVKINAPMVRNKRNGGKKNENEWTQVEIFDLAELLKKRDLDLVRLDLLTSRLLDEVAKATELLVKTY